MSAASFCGGGELFMKPLSSLDILSMLEAYDDEELSASREAGAPNGERRAISWVTSAGLVLAARA
uniref:Uncharacterized protein n=1 Tax=Arundo donax TaxID=35708 RepID=A0A0A9CE90_ARUDO